MPTNSVMVTPPLASTMTQTASKRPADAKVFTDQVEQTAHGGGAQSRAHFLNHGERNGDQQQHPQQFVAELRADLLIGRNPPASSPAVAASSGLDREWPESRERPLAGDAVRGAWSLRPRIVTRTPARPSATTADVWRWWLWSTDGDRHKPARSGGGWLPTLTRTPWALDRRHEAGSDVRQGHVDGNCAKEAFITTGDRQRGEL